MFYLKKIISGQSMHHYNDPTIASNISSNSDIYDQHYVENYLNSNFNDSKMEDEN